MRTLGIVAVLLAASHAARGQLGVVNRAPQFLPNGDMSRFAIPEDTPVGTPVYKLSGSDPEGSRVIYSISGDHFTVDKDTGIVSTVREFDREKQDLITVVISVTDEGIGGSEPNTVSLLREIPVLDINDNYPIFYNRPYSFSLFENTIVGKKLFENITVEDADGGINGDIILSCTPPGDETCSIFDISTEKITDGKYKGIITLVKPLDYERRSTHSMTIKATDRAKDPKRRLTATANIVIDVLDIQDQPPVFINAPYSATVSENTEEGTSILRVGARDGDIGDPRTVRLEILNDYLDYFRLRPLEEESAGEETPYPITLYDVVTAENPLDREHPDILQNGGIYTFTIRAVELINNELPAEFSETTVTIVIRDEDDQLPMFNQDMFEIFVSEDIGLDSPLPGLNMIITDEDIGDNAQYFLSLRDIQNVGNTFAVQPRSGTGRTAVVVRVNDTTNLDYDVDDPNLRTLVFDIVAGVSNEYGVVREVAMSRVAVHLLDANDNAPKFENQSYYVSVPEDFPPNAMIYEVSASDPDSGEFGTVRYYLKGFGSHKFKTDRMKGGIYTASSSLDYETQKSYNLNLVAMDGGNRTTSTNVYVDVEDVNDNKPSFDSKEYSRIIRESATAFEPAFYVRATDADGPKHGGGNIEYEIVSKNHNRDVIEIDKDTGELLLRGPVSSGDTPKGQYEMVIRAWDHGSPRLYEDVRVNVRVGVVGNQRPYFKGNVRNQNGGPVYMLTVGENIKPNEEIKKLEAVDPDGADARLLYYLADGGKDNFIVEETTGILKTSPYSNFDLETNPNSYELTVITIDSGSPVPETGSTSVIVNVTDVNNKPPRFSEATYTTYVIENTEINSTVLTVKAEDPDENFKIRYKILKPLKVYDKAGLLSEKNDEVFEIDEETGDVRLKMRLDHNLVNYVIARIEAEDVNGEEGEQTAVAEALVYVQATNEKTPIFMATNWTAKNPVIKIRINEEIDKNTIVYTLKAKDPIRNKTRIRYEAYQNEHYDVFNVSENGNVIVLKRLDYEEIPRKVYNLSVRAVVVEELHYDIRKSPTESVLDLQNAPKVRYTDSVLSIDIVNINDNPPIFEEETYTRRVLESVKHPDVILRVKAYDADNDTVTYTISGENANHFFINSTTGEVTVARNVTLDREKRHVYKLNVTASDKNASGRTKIHKTTAQIVLEVLDVNDNPPVFGRSLYSAVIPENVSPGTMITRVQATDADLGVSGEVRYQIIEESDAVGFFRIDPETGEVSTNRALTGKGRNEPYNIIIKASDKGDLALDANGRKNQKSLSSEVTLSIYVGDVVKNDGVPVFIKPTLNQVIEVSENASLGTPVFQVIASDPDDANRAEGQIRYKFLEDGKLGDDNPFKIHFESGLISTKLPLDRETKASYDVIIVAHDLGEVPQQATRVLHIEILDVDDHKPYFKRSIDEPPMVVNVVEESPTGSEIGFVQAIDDDTGDNAKIDYVISNGNDKNIFSITRTEDNVGVLIANERLDREEADHHLLTVKCYKLSEDGKKLNYYRPYNRQDPSERQILIKVADIDDNDPKFEMKNVSIGVRLNVPPETTLLTLIAVDEDADSPPMEYHMERVMFTRLGRTDKKATDMMEREEKVFSVDIRTGELKTTSSLQNFGDGYFDLVVSANNTGDPAKKANITVRVFMLRDRGLLRFVFNDPPVEVKKRIPELESAVASALSLPVKVNVYDTQFHSKKDGSLDFSSTSSCFQIIGKEPYTIKEMEKLLDDGKNKNLKRVFSKFNIQEVGRCAAVSSKTETSWVEIWVLVISALIGVLAIIAACTICCLYRRYKKMVKRRSPRAEAQSQPDYMTIRSGRMASSGSVLGSQLMIPNSHLSGSQMYISKSDRSVLGSQILVPKGSQLMINQPATQLGSQLIINNPKTNYGPSTQGSAYGERGGNTTGTGNGPIIVGSSQMLVPNNNTIINEGGYDEQSHIFNAEDLGSQVMYEYVGDGADNMAFEDNS